ncbi:hypothetical protein [Bacteroides sp.]
MEVKTLSQTAEGALQTTVITLAFGNEELKEFYLKEAIFLNPLSYNHPHSDTESLQLLLKDLKRICGFLTKISSHHWDDMAKFLQTVGGAYPAQNPIGRKEHLKMNESLSDIMSLIIMLSNDRRETGKLLNHFNRHYMNVKRLLEQEQEEG